MNEFIQGRLTSFVFLMIFIVILLIETTCNGDSLPAPSIQDGPELGEPISIDFPQVKTPTVPIDNRFLSTGDWTEWKQPSPNYKGIQARVICLTQFGSRYYNIQFRNYYTSRAKITFSSTSSLYAAPSEDIFANANGSVSKQTSMHQHCEFSSKNYDVYLSIDKVLVEQQPID